MSKEDFNIHLDEDSNLIISMEKKSEDKHDDKRYLRHEFSYTKFQQAMILPDDVDIDAISAEVNNGVLDIRLPKLVKQDLPKVARNIEIK